MNANGSVQTSMILSLPDGVASIAVTDFSLYGNQDPGIGTNTLVFGDFSKTPSQDHRYRAFLPRSHSMRAINPSLFPHKTTRVLPHWRITRLDGLQL